MKIGRFLLPICGLLAASPVIAQNPSPEEQWVQVVRDTGLGVTHYVDIRSIRAGNGFRQAWVKDVPTKVATGYASTEPSTSSTAVSPR